MKVYCWLVTEDYDGHWLITVSETEEEARALLLAKYGDPSSSHITYARVKEQLQEKPRKVRDITVDATLSLGYGTG